MGHLTDRGFCRPIVDEAEAAAQKKRQELEQEIEKVKKAYEEKQKRNAEKRKQKKTEQGKTVAEKGEDGKSEEAEDAKDEKEKENKVPLPLLDCRYSIISNRCLARSKSCRRVSRIPTMSQESLLCKSRQTPFHSHSQLPSAPFLN